MNPLPGRSILRNLSWNQSRTILPGTAPTMRLPGSMKFLIPGNSLKSMNGSVQTDVYSLFTLMGIVGIVMLLISYPMMEDAPLKMKSSKNKDFIPFFIVFTRRKVDDFGRKKIFSSIVLD